MRTIKMTMTQPQADFFMLLDKYPAFIGGFGAGKTETMANSALRDGLEAPFGIIALYEPTYDLVRLILAPRMEQKLSDLGIRYKYNKQENIIYASSGGCGDFILRTLDNPARIVGYEAYRSHVDEIDTLKKEHAKLAWQKIIARNRQKPKWTPNPFNRVSVYTTPEGFNFVYETWGKDPKPGYVMVRSPTRLNPFLPDDYVETLRASYPAQLIDAYLEGLFVNLTSGRVYPEFCRVQNHCDTNVDYREPVHVGLDFNVNKMAGIVHVIRDDLPRAVAEHVKVRDTPAMCEKLRDLYLLEGHEVHVYPDASGNNTSSKSASLSDIGLLRAAGFIVHAHDSNPRVKDRVNSVNAMILNDFGQRRYLVNTVACPEYTSCLEQQPYDKNGEPDKKSGHDHAADAGGYFITYTWPLNRQQFVF